MERARCPSGIADRFAAVAAEVADADNVAGWSVAS
jgi:hypothetical protein